jgi:hypothetical protein
MIIVHVCLLWQPRPPIVRKEIVAVAGDVYLEAPILVLKGHR